MGQNLFAKDIMNKPIVWVSPGDTLREAAKKMLEHDLSQLPVQRSERYEGRVTDVMLCHELHKARGRGVPTRKVDDLDEWGKKFKGIAPSTPFDDIVPLLLDDQAVLVREGAKPTDWGIVARYDLLKALR
jgi:predicted transcriptional regulator